MYVLVELVLKITSTFDIGHYRIRQQLSESLGSICPCPDPARLCASLWALGTVLGGCWKIVTDHWTW